MFILIVIFDFKKIMIEFFQIITLSEFIIFFLLLYISFVDVLLIIHSTAIKLVSLFLQIKLKF